MNTRVYLNGRNAPDRSRTARGTLSGEEFRLPDVRTGYPVARLNNMEVESLEDFPRGDGYSVAVSPRPELDTGGLAVVGRVLVLAKLLERSVTRALKPLGLSLSAFDMLAMIRRHGEPLRMTPAELARATMLTSGAMTNRIDRLEERGLVRREPDPFDGRSIHVVLTEEGRVRPAGAAAFGQRTEAKSKTYAYEQTEDVSLGEAYESRFQENPEAWKFFAGQAPWYRKKLIWWVVSAKRQETRARRLAKLIEASADGKRL